MTKRFYEEELRKITQVVKQQDNEQEFVPLDSVLAIFSSFANHSITWTSSDFEYRAREFESEKAMKNFDHIVEVPVKWQIYNRSKFEQAALQMIRKHDCNIGITWDDVDYYLNEYCV